MILKVRNWEKFQHYKDRKPPWIKLHFSLLTSKDWVMLTDSERVLAIACMLVASHSDLDSGCFEADADYIKRLAYLNNDPDFKPLVQHGFLEIVEADASERKQMLAKATTETEKRQSREEKKTVGKKRTEYPPDFEKLWQLYPGTAGSKKEAYAEFKKADIGADEMAAAIQNQIEFKQKQEKAGEFVASWPHLCRWIKKERWNDKMQLEAPEKVRKILVAVRDSASSKPRYADMTEEEIASLEASGYKKGVDGVYEKQISNGIVDL